MIYLEFYIVLKKKKKRMIFLSKERQRWVRLTILSKRGNMRRMKMLFWLFFPRARGASIGIFSPSGIYHQKIRIIIILVFVCLSWFMIGRHKWGRLRRRYKTNCSKLFTKLCLNSQLREAILEIGISAIFSSKCCVLHLRTFVGFQTTNVHFLPV